MPAYEMVEKRTEELRRQNPSLSWKQAFTQALAEHPQLYLRYHAQALAVDDALSRLAHDRALMEQALKDLALWQSIEGTALGMDNRNLSPVDRARTVARFLESPSGHGLYTLCKAELSSIQE
jgi:hypothetical protein